MFDRQGTRRARHLNNSYAMIDAAIVSLGIAYVPENIVESRIASGELEQVLDEWSLMFDGYFLCYPAASKPGRLPDHRGNSQVSRVINPVDPPFREP